MVEGSSEAPSPEDIRRKIEKAMRDRKSFMKSARASFEQFDADKSGTLSFEETKKLLARLSSNLQLPPVEPPIVQGVFERYDSSKTGQLGIEQFCNMYYQLLCRIRDKYYPTKKMRVRRDFFVGRQNLDAEKPITDLFEFESKLGSGAFGDVHLVKEVLSGLQRVIKVINKDRSAVPVEQIEAEVEVLKSLDHPNIIKIFEVYEDYNNMYIVMECCHGGELLGRIVAAQEGDRYVQSEEFVRDIMQQLCSSLVYFHGKNVAHKDLKPENLLFQDPSAQSPVKVIDFGLAELFEKGPDAQSDNSAGTALYMAPEVFMRGFTTKCDVWSAGVIMYFLLTGQLPFKGQTIEEVQYRVCYHEPNFAKDCATLPPDAVSLLRQMLDKRPSQRPTAAECLDHKWFSSPKVKVALSPSIQENMKRYMRQSDLKNALVNMMAHQLNVSGSQIRKINDIFKTFDRDGNGTLSHSEVTEGLLEAGVAQWDINRIIQSIDVDDSGHISYTEFLAACYTWRESELNVLWTAFNKMDKNGDGRVTTEEFCTVILGGNSKLIPTNELRSLVESIDKNKDGIIDWDEFLAYMRSS